MPSFDWEAVTADASAGWTGTPGTAFVGSTIANPSFTVNGPIRGFRFNAPINGDTVSFNFSTNETGPVTPASFRPVIPAGSYLTGPYVAVSVNGVTITLGGFQADQERQNAGFRLDNGVNEFLQFQFSRPVTNLQVTGSFFGAGEGLENLEVQRAVPEPAQVPECACCIKPLNRFRCWLPESIGVEAPPSAWGSFGGAGATQYVPVAEQGRVLISPDQARYTNFGGVPGLEAELTVPTTALNSPGSFTLNPAGGHSWLGPSTHALYYHLRFSRPVYLWGLIAEDWDNGPVGTREQAYHFQPPFTFTGPTTHYSSQISNTCNVNAGSSQCVFGLDATGQGWVTFQNVLTTELFWINQAPPNLGGTYWGVLFSPERKAICTNCAGDVQWLDIESGEAVPFSRLEGASIPPFSFFRPLNVGGGVNNPRYGWERSNDSGTTYLTAFPTVAFFGAQVLGPTGTQRYRQRFSVPEGAGGTFAVTVSGDIWDASVNQNAQVYYDGAFQGNVVPLAGPTVFNLPAVPGPHTFELWIGASDDNGGATAPVITVNFANTTQVIPC